MPIITINIDKLHKKAESQNFIEIHRNLEHVKCPRCNTLMILGEGQG
ncbi:Sir2 family NAD-dependent protein deacetylase [Fervidobacterium nodosum]